MTTSAEALRLSFLPGPVQPGLTTAGDAHEAAATPSPAPSYVGVSPENWA